MRDNIRKHTYLSRADFMEHINLIVSNSRVYNGTEDPLTQVAKTLRKHTTLQFEVKPLLLLFTGFSPDTFKTYTPHTFGFLF